MVADMEEDKMADMKADMVADMEVANMVADVEVDMVADMEANMVANKVFLSQTFLRPTNNFMDSFTNYFKALVFLFQLSTLFLKTIYHN